VWGGFSTKWYGELVRDDRVLDALKLSVGIAVTASTGAVIIGTLAAYGLTRFGKFRGRSLLSGLVTAPLVLPEVTTGLSMLLLFVLMEKLTGWPQGRGASTIAIAHITFAVAYATVVIQARIAALDPSLEEAAADLGARPVSTFFSVVLPLIAPSLAAAWLLSFSLSLDDFIITAFVTGPGATTLPLLIYSSVKLGVNPEINALGTLIIAIASLVALTATVLRRNAN
ncbi:MAG TPA: ABC transporter permease subunit, partial [Alphaproteobacteria bacterium]|nr:ABC transporter permease subunit [Alphaproteobacteria bacterium]